MASIDKLFEQITDPKLREVLRREVNLLKQSKRFGLVFEHHAETAALAGLPIRIGTLVERSDTNGSAIYEVKAITNRGRTALIVDFEVNEENCDVLQLLVHKRLGDPIYPGLTSLGEVRRASEKPYHAVINGENFHTLQLLTYLLEGGVDCIYVDPPYNTGARDWKYNNRYVDRNDLWRHSKWLSFMEKRLRLAGHLLKSDGVLIVTIDENEVSHLGLLLEELFPDALRQMVTICINPSGVSGDGLSRVEEYAYFCFFGGTRPNRTVDDFLSATSDETALVVEWESLLRRGNVWYRETRKNLCYPVLLDPNLSIVGVGEPFDGEDEDSRPRDIGGMSAAWPIRKDGRLGIWRVEGKRLMALAERGYAYVSSRDDVRDTWTIKYLMSGTVDAIDSGEIPVLGRGPRGQVLLGAPSAKGTTTKTMWHRGRHTAGGAGGTQALAAFLGARGLFPFPKSINAVEDCLSIAIGDRPEATILDFFAGSGTTLHATCMLNAKDGGRRRSILVTNNEVSSERIGRLTESGIYPGDPEFEKHGIFEAVTRPRCEASITGMRPDGKPVDGSYLDGRSYAEGFEENLEFFRLDYLDPDEVEIGSQLKAILPALWLSAGGIGEREIPKADTPFTLPEGCTYGILMRPSRFRPFREAVEKRPDVTHVWLVTDSEEAFAEMATALPRQLRVSMLYRDYLRNFRINTRRTL